MNFQRQLEFTNMVVNQLSLDSRAGTQVCVASFSTEAALHVSLGAVSDKNALTDSILGIPYL